MKCNNCGVELQEGAKFCSNCGTPVVEKLEEVETKPDKNLDETQVFDGKLVEVKDKHLEEILKEIEKADDDRDLREVEDIEDFEEDVFEDIIPEDLEETMVIDPISDDFLEEEDDEYYYKEPFVDKLKRNKGILIGLVLALVLVLVFALTRGPGKEEAKEELINNFIDALAARDISDTRKLLQSPTSDLKIDSQGVEALFAYIDENPSFIEKTRTELERQSKFYDDKKSDDIGDITSNIMLRKDGKNTYFLEVTPYYMNIKVGAEGTKIFIENKEVAKATEDDFSKEFGPFMPGIYKIGGRYEASFGELETEKFVELMEDKPNPTRQIMDFFLEMEVSYINIVTEHGDAYIVVDGKKTGQQVKDLEAGKLGPISQESKIKLVVETPLGSFESKEYLVGEYGDRLEISIPMGSEKVKEDIIKAANKFIEDDLKARQTLDIGVFTNLISPAKENIQAQLNEMAEEGYIIESDLKERVYDLDSIKVSKHDGDYYGQVDMYYSLSQVYLWEFSTETLEDKKYQNIGLKYDEGSKDWKVFELTGINGINENNTKRY